MGRFIFLVFNYSLMQIIFDDYAEKKDEIKLEVEKFLKEIKTLEEGKDAPVIIFQDGKSKGYYIKCQITAKNAVNRLDFDAKLSPSDVDSFRANRELLLSHNTYLRMKSDTSEGREFNDIIVEYNKDYNQDTPLKIWGGQHRSKAIQEAFKSDRISRYHGFKVFFKLNKNQRTEIALVSNTNMNVSNDLFDRLQEETFIGARLRNWCQIVGLLKDDFPDKRAGTDKISVKLARTFVTNYYLGYEKGKSLTPDILDKQIYEPHICESGAHLDDEYLRINSIYKDSLWSNKEFIEAGKSFALLHSIQQNSVKNKANKISKKKEFQNKAITESVISAWAFVAGLLQIDPIRLKNTTKYLKPQKQSPIH
jgi:hypothetical protein